MLVASRIAQVWFRIVYASVFFALTALLFVGAANATPLSQIQIEVGAHSAPVRRLGVDEQRRLLVTAAEDKSARVWSLDSGELLHILRPIVSNERIGILYGAAVHPTKPLVALGGSTGAENTQHRIYFFNHVTGSFEGSFDALGGDIKNLAWSTDGSLLLAIYAGDHAVRAFQPDGSLLFEEGLATPGYGLQSSNNGLVAAVSLDGSVMILKVANGNVEKKASFTTKSRLPVSLSFSADGAMLVIGFYALESPPEIYEVSSGRLLSRLKMPQVQAGSIERVTWSADDKSIVAAGRASLDNVSQYPVYWFDSKSGELTKQFVVANDSVLELRPISDGNIAFSSADGSWGIVSPSGLKMQSKSPVPVIWNDAELLLNSTATLVSWSIKSNRLSTQFSFEDRLVSKQSDSVNWIAPKTRMGLFDSPDWKGVFKPKVNGNAVSLREGETSRALTYLRSSDGEAILGTSQRLIRLGEKGDIAWEVATAGEVRALNVSEDNRLIVSAMTDGTLRWWRATDGLLLLTLLAMPEGKWISWTLDGFYDAGPGADQMAGWVVNRQDSTHADYFSLNRFRSKFNRPAMIDEVLRTANPAEPVRSAAGAEQSATIEPNALLTGSEVKFPPVFDPVEQPSTLSSRGILEVPFSIRSTGDELEVEVRADGRPLPDAQVSFDRNGSQVTGMLTTLLPKDRSLVQILAKDENGVSEPLNLGLKVISKLTSGASPDSREHNANVGSANSTAKQSKPSAEISTAVVGQAIAPPRIAVTSIALPKLAELTEERKTFTADRAGKLIVLSIGISEYQRKEYQLGLAAKDAVDFGAMLKAQGQKNYSEVIVRTLTNDDATRKNIVDSLGWLSASAGPYDVGVLFMAGHGINSANGVYYFMPFEADHKNLKATAVPEAAFRRTLGQMRGKALMFVDTCFGGAALSKQGSFELAALANNLASAENGVLVFASSTGRQLSEERNSWNNGAFTSALLSGIQGLADPYQTGRITITGLIHYVSQQVRKLTSGRQSPVLISPVGVPDYALVVL